MKRRGGGGKGGNSDDFLKQLGQSVLSSFGGRKGDFMNFVQRGGYGGGGGGGYGGGGYGPFGGRPGPYGGGHFRGGGYGGGSAGGYGYGYTNFSVPFGGGRRRGMNRLRTNQAKDPTLSKRNIARSRQLLAKFKSKRVTEGWSDSDQFLVHYLSNVMQDLTPKDLPSPHVQLLLKALVRHRNAPKLLTYECKLLLDKKFGSGGDETTTDEEIREKKLSYLKEKKKALVDELNLVFKKKKPTSSPAVAAIVVKKEEGEEVAADDAVADNGAATEEQTPPEEGEENFEEKAALVDAYFGILSGETYSEEEHKPGLEDYIQDERKTESDYVNDFKYEFFKHCYEFFQFRIKENIGFDATIERRLKFHMGNAIVPLFLIERMRTKVDMVKPPKTVMKYLITMNGKELRQDEHLHAQIYKHVLKLKEEYQQTDISDYIEGQTKLSLEALRDFADTILMFNKIASIIRYLLLNYTPHIVLPLETKNNLFDELVKWVYTECLNCLKNDVRLASRAIEEMERDDGLPHVPKTKKKKKKEGENGEANGGEDEEATNNGEDVEMKNEDTNMDTA